MMNMWPQYGGMQGGPGQMPPMNMPGMPMPGMPLPLSAPMRSAPGLRQLQPPSISESQRKYMQQIVLGMKTSDIGVVAHSLSQAVNERVQMPDAFLATVKQWMASRQESVAASSQMQLAQFIGHQAWVNQVNANFQALQTPDAGSPAPPVPPETSAGFVSSQANNQSVSYQDSTPMTGDATPTILGGKTPALTGAQTPTVVPSDSYGFSGPAPSVTERQPTQTQVPSSVATSSLRTETLRSRTLSQPTETATASERSRTKPRPPPPEFTYEPTELEPPVPEAPRRLVARHIEVERSAEEVADFLRQQEDDRATFQRISKHFKLATQKIRQLVEDHEDLFAVEKDQVVLKDQRRKEALRCLVKQLVSSEMQKMEIDPEKAMECIWSAAHFAIKATPSEVKKVFDKVSQSVLRSKQTVPRGAYPANMPLALACIIDRAVYLARRLSQGAITAIERALGPSLYNILLSRWQLGRVRGSQFLANLFLAWERLGYFEDKHLETCKKHLLVLLAFVRAEGVPDPPHKDEGTGWYKVVAREPGEDKNTEPIASRQRLQALEQTRAQAEKQRVTVTADASEASEKAQAQSFQEARDRVMHAMAQMGLQREADRRPPPTETAAKRTDPSEFPEPIKPHKQAPPTASLEKAPPEPIKNPPEPVKADKPGKGVGEDPEEVALFGSAIYDSPVYSEEEIFGSPQEMDDEDPSKPGTAKEAETLPYDDMAATQPYASQESQDSQKGMDATQAYQDEPLLKRRRLSGDEMLP